MADEYDDLIDGIYFDDGGQEVIFYEDPYNHDNRMIHSISFTPYLDASGLALIDTWYNTFRLWHLVPKTRPVVNPPKARTEYSIVKSANGVLDFSESLNGVHFDNRTGTWEFAVDHELNTEMSWNEIYDDILLKIHGKRVRLVLQDDPGFYYTGRVSINEWKSDKYWSEIAIDYDLDPYKRSVNTSGDFDWLFDVAAEERNKQLVYARFMVDKVKYRDFFYTGSKDIKPVIACSEKGMIVQTHYNSKNIRLTLVKEPTTYDGIYLKPGHNYFTFYGDGVVSVYYNLGASL